MNDEQKRTQKLNKFGRQIGYLAHKIMMLSQRDMCEIRGNGLVITVRKWEDVANEVEYIKDKGEDKTQKEESGDKGRIEQKESKEECKEETPKEETLSDAAFKKQTERIREGWEK